mmetsp:Transcript_12938/g.32802  ORF Transcript_12938/g.32802 Transcript_12938/m.32802 type:complete len:156 (+) Transcript_12938:126-593(+)|eukprot:CAMPEP_0174886256 /NCGR_PEP_ID=MMETSP0167-20121228/1523_1 /TAXON_ID=38298 /ORGANISM="Rhodella maculata, Strain CCMP736" /LENGTH=155 /DNA_ID=CAMNT_0016122187 /DNA_START=63 /DNA_END=530 /DNA_ORIENTATION=-
MSSFDQLFLDVVRSLPAAQQAPFLALHKRCSAAGATAASSALTSTSDLDELFSRHFPAEASKASPADELEAGLVKAMGPRVAVRLAARWRDEAPERLEAMWKKHARELEAEVEVPKGKRVCVEKSETCSVVTAAVEEDRCAREDFGGSKKRSLSC